MKPHDWIRSTIGHGEVMCRDCFITNREAAMLGSLNRCDAEEERDPEPAPPIPTPQED